MGWTTSSHRDGGRHAPNASHSVTVDSTRLPLPAAQESPYDNRSGIQHDVTSASAHMQGLRQTSIRNRHAPGKTRGGLFQAIIRCFRGQDSHPGSYKNDRQACSQAAVGASHGQTEQPPSASATLPGHASGISGPPQTPPPPSAAPHSQQQLRDASNPQEHTSPRSPLAPSPTPPETLTVIVPPPTQAAAAAAAAAAPSGGDSGEAATTTPSHAFYRAIGGGSGCVSFERGVHSTAAAATAAAATAAVQPARPSQSAPYMRLNNHSLHMPYSTTEGGLGFAVDASLACMVDAAAVAVAAVARVGPMTSRSFGRSGAAAASAAAAAAAAALEASAAGMAGGPASGGQSQRSQSQLQHRGSLLTSSGAAPVALQARPSLTSLAAMAAAAGLPLELPAKAFIDDDSTVSISCAEDSEDDGLPSPSEAGGPATTPTTASATAATAAAFLPGLQPSGGCGCGGDVATATSAAGPTGGGPDSGFRSAGRRRLLQETAEEAAFIRGTLAALKQATLAGVDEEGEAAVLPGLPRVWGSNQSGQRILAGYSNAAAAAAAAATTSGTVGTISGGGGAAALGSTSSSVGVMGRVAVSPVVHEANLAALFGGGRGGGGGGGRRLAATMASSSALSVNMLLPALAGVSGGGGGGEGMAPRLLQLPYSPHGASSRRQSLGNERMPYYNARGSFTVSSSVAAIEEGPCEGSSTTAGSHSAVYGEGPYAVPQPPSGVVGSGLHHQQMSDGIYGPSYGSGHRAVCDTNEQRMVTLTAARRYADVLQQVFSSRAADPAATTQQLPQQERNQQQQKQRELEPPRAMVAGCSTGGIGGGRGSNSAQAPAAVGAPSVLPLPAAATAAEAEVAAMTQLLGDEQRQILARLVLEKWSPFSFAAPPPPPPSRVQAPPHPTSPAAAAAAVTTLTSAATTSQSGLSDSGRGVSYAVAAAAAASMPSGLRLDPATALQPLSAPSKPLSTSLYAAASIPSADRQRVSDGGAIAVQLHVDHSPHPVGKHVRLQGPGEAVPAAAAASATAAAAATQDPPRPVQLRQQEQRQRPEKQQRHQQQQPFAGKLVPWAVTVTGIPPPSSRRRKPKPQPEQSHEQPGLGEKRCAAVPDAGRTAAIPSGAGAAAAATAVQLPSPPSPSAVTGPQEASGPDMSYIRLLVQRKWSPFFDLAASISPLPPAATMPPTQPPAAAATSLPPATASATPRHPSSKPTTGAAAAAVAVAVAVSSAAVGTDNSLPPPPLQPSLRAARGFPVSGGGGVAAPLSNSCPAIPEEPSAPGSWLLEGLLDGGGEASGGGSAGGDGGSRGDGAGDVGVGDPGTDPVSKS